MQVLQLTVFFSLLLALLFAVLFAAERRRRRPYSGVERMALLPLEEEGGVRPAGKEKKGIEA